MSDVVPGVEHDSSHPDSVPIHTEEELGTYLPQPPSWFRFTLTLVQVSPCTDKDPDINPGVGHSDRGSVTGMKSFVKINQNPK